VVVVVVVYNSRNKIAGEALHHQGLKVKIKELGAEGEWRGGSRLNKPNQFLSNKLAEIGHNKAVTNNDPVSKALRKS
jgi:hypothetical protein